jgi:hypothetical protein
MEDLIEEVVGEIRDEYDPDTHHALRLRGGDIVTDGLLNLDQFEEATGVRLPEGPYETAAGYVVACLGHLPGLGESVECAGVRLTVTRLDGRRIDRLRVTRLAPPDEDADAPWPGPAEPESPEPAQASVSASASSGAIGAATAEPPPTRSGELAAGDAAAGDPAEARTGP